MLATLDLFAGVGGFTLGLEEAGGFETKAFCEIDAFAQKVLKKNWPHVLLLNDVRAIQDNTIDCQIDMITGGFPCQDLSIAGLKGGLIDNERSGLWRECIRLVRLFRPKYAVFENVSNLLAEPDYAPGGWFSTILRDLAASGYDAEWQNIPACAVGGQHNRERVWIIAHPQSRIRKMPERQLLHWRGSAAVTSIQITNRPKGSLWLTRRFMGKGCRPNFQSGSWASR